MTKHKTMMDIDTANIVVPFSDFIARAEMYDEDSFEAAAALIMEWVEEHDLVTNEFPSLTPRVQELLGAIRMRRQK